ncbi:MAG: phosphatase PAP2 family protein [Candidatus Aenigmarchaeota archaeon]|nr:phosphatase PAP2 family protein [Candidatus Aenigmarchaeota archaeon]
MIIKEMVSLVDEAFFNFISLFDFSKIYFISFLSYYFFYLIFLIFVIYIYFFERKTKVLNLLIILSILGFLIIYLIKYTVKRERPYGIIEKIDYSFPSSHSYFATLIILFSYFYLKNYIFKSLFVIFGLFSIFSILILKIHYLSDVIFSIFLSLFLFYLFNNKDSLIKYIEKLREVKKKKLNYLKRTE